MCADCRAYIGVIHIFESEFLFDCVSEIPGFIRYVGVTDVKHLVLRINDEFINDLMDAPDRIFLASDLFLYEQMTFKVKIENGVNAERVSILPAANFCELPQSYSPIYPAYNI